MDLSPPASASMAPPTNNNGIPESEHGPASANHNSNNNNNSHANHSHSSLNNNHANGAGAGDASSGAVMGGESAGHAQSQPTGAAAAAQQPKVVQTAFIHKLYSQYFKHTNVSSFVRQLNMYGFHKVSDVFHTGSPDSQMWEFKHGNGNFKKGDVAGLREIKRRASRQTLIHRDSFSGHKPSSSQPATPAEPLPEAADSRVIDSRLLNTEHNIYDLHARLSRMEENYSQLNSRCQALTESLVRCHQWSNSMSHFVMSIVPDPDNAIHRDAANMQREISRQLDAIRAYENPHESLLSGRQPYFGSMTLHSGPPLSPRQMPQDESRRPSMAQAPVPAHLAVSPRRYGSIGAANSSPNYNRPQIPPQQPAPHPLSSVAAAGPNLGRRHTSADIREHGWGATNNNATSPSAPNHASPQWPPSPQQTAHHPNNTNTNNISMNQAPPLPTADHQHVRDLLARYEMGCPRRNTNQDTSRHSSPPPPISIDPVAAPPQLPGAAPHPPYPHTYSQTQTHPHPPQHPLAAHSSSSSSSLNPESGWSVSGPKFPRPAGDSLPATRRSSMASNVHSLLNPTAATAERERPGEDDGVGEDRKRKRLQ
ncbi:HSF-type DNA-binding domain-containing protein [Histoplasma capsulatum var. duboisii H88]|uniref:HSF-type DNA-binding domain-containing protein n=1 Tax=Ajellomyces capsulatus (strain H88) TaxID=544711 RepID=F0UI94_AJEC8|nr:HSF-type DNA-binding domain-containing protein [Histoplasma capsulatum var. duboisii H88]